MTYKQEYSSITFVVAPPEECMVIHVSLLVVYMLSLDKHGRLIDDTGRWNADGKERSNG